MSCNNCYNGCVEITSDKCVRYTGIGSVPLGIATGDTLLSVETILINNVVSFLTGTGIDITIDPTAYCTLVSSFLPEGTPTLIDVLTALVKAACALQVEALSAQSQINTIDAPLTVGCLTGVTSTSGIHDIVQAVITKLCTVETNLTALTLDVDTNYVKLADLNTLIQAYLDSIVPSTQYGSRMVPYSAVEYYGTLANFDVTGAGLAGPGFTDIYLCNGLNGTPDKRGRVAVGAIVSVPGGALDSTVNPSYTGNPNYAIGDSGGANTITLTESQLPAHTHINTLTDPTHTHLLFGGSQGTTTGTTIDATHVMARANDNSQTNGYIGINSPDVATYGLSGATSSGVSINNTAIGGGTAHANIQPVKACYYIMYIPS